MQLSQRAGGRAWNAATMQCASTLPQTIRPWPAARPTCSCCGLARLAQSSTSRQPRPPLMARPASTTAVSQPSSVLHTNRAVAACVGTRGDGRQAGSKMSPRHVGRAKRNVTTAQQNPGRPRQPSRHAHPHHTTRDHTWLPVCSPRPPSVAAAASPAAAQAPPAGSSQLSISEASREHVPCREASSGNSTRVSAPAAEGWG